MSDNQRTPFIVEPFKEFLSLNTAQALSPSQQSFIRAKIGADSSGGGLPVIEDEIYIDIGGSNEESETRYNVETLYDAIVLAQTLKVAPEYGIYISNSLQDIPAFDLSLKGVYLPNCSIDLYGDLPEDSSSLQIRDCCFRRLSIQGTVVGFGYFEADRHVGDIQVHAQRVYVDQVLGSIDMRVTNTAEIDHCMDVELDIDWSASDNVVSIYASHVAGLSIYANNLPSDLETDDRLLNLSMTNGTDVYISASVDGFTTSIYDSTIVWSVNRSAGATRAWDIGVAGRCQFSGTIQLDSAVTSVFTVSGGSTFSLVTNSTVITGDHTNRWFSYSQNEAITPNELNVDAACFVMDSTVIS